MKSPNYVAVLAILNAILHRVSESLPLIDQATESWGAIRFEGSRREMRLRVTVTKRRFYSRTNISLSFHS